MRGRPVFSVAAVWLAALCFGLGCGQTPATQPSADATATPQSSLKVLAAETFLADIAQNVAGDRVRVGALLPIGVDPHSYEPTPDDVVKVATSDVLIVNGAGFEAFLERLLQNAGGQHNVIEASAGLTPRGAREGEVAEMSDAELADAMCAQATGETPQAVTSGAGLADAMDLPAESGVFEVSLAPQAGGTFGGYAKYVTDAGGSIQVVIGAGMVSVTDAGGASPLRIDRVLPLSCGGVTQGNLLTLKKDVQYVVALSGFKTAKATLVVGPAGGLERHATDPHFWLDPTKVVKYAENIRDGLSAADPQGAPTYAANAARYSQQLNDLDKWISEQVTQIPEQNRQLVTNHESLGYFADRYGFVVVGTVVPSVSSDASPSAQQLARLVDRIKATHARAVFLETGTNPQLAQQIARETGVKVVTDVYTHSTTDASGPAPTYIDMMKHNTEAIVSALK